MSRYATTLLTPVLLALLAFPALAEDAPNYKQDTLTGDWGGVRSSLSAKGIDTEISYTFDAISNVSGGFNEGTRGLDNLDIIATFDGEKLLGAKGTSATLHLLNNNGGRPNDDLVGSAQGVDNIEVPKATGKLYEAWIQQNLLEDKISVLAGLYAVDSEFEVTETSQLFLHSTYGVGTDLSQSGRNGPPIFPFSALAARVKLQPTADSYFQVAVTDGVPGDETNPEGTQIELNKDEGALVIAEAGYTASGKIAVGAWHYTEKLDQINGATDADGNPLKARSQGFYIIGQHNITKGLDGFARLGFADNDTNQFDVAWSTGLVYTGLIPTRTEGKLGLAVAGAHNSSPFKHAAADAGTPLDTTETAFELTYSDNITPWLSMQPDVQYIINPATDPALDNALVLGLRTKIAF